MTSGPVPGDHAPVTTNGTVALVNLSAQIEGLAAPRQGAEPGTPFAVAQRAVLVDLLTLRGHLLGRVSDYDHAARIAERLVRDDPSDPMALLARAHSRATLHCFAEAMADIDAAGRAGSAQAVLDGERAGILQAVGCHAEARTLIGRAAPRQSGFTVLGARAVLHAERGEAAEAEQVFDEALRTYQGVSPFPLAQLHYRRGVMWMREGDLPAARTWFEAARRRVPGYAPATGHLAEVDLLSEIPRPPSHVFARWWRRATTPSTPPVSRWPCGTWAGIRRPCGGGTVRRSVTTTWCCVIRRRTPTMPPTSGSWWVPMPTGAFTWHCGAWSCAARPAPTPWSGQCPGENPTSAPLSRPDPVGRSERCTSSARHPPSGRSGTGPATSGRGSLAVREPGRAGR